MKEPFLFELAEKAGLSKAQLAEAVIDYVGHQVSRKTAEQLRFMLMPLPPSPPPPPRTHKRLTVHGKQKTTLSVAFTSPKKDTDNN